jgi:hypothetical protein
MLKKMCKKKTTVSSCLLNVIEALLNYAILAKILLKVALGRIALLVNSGFGW